ncbi:MAG: winged helix-turn-helix transcriptional regulator [Candidatus Bathyarchaeota archaeon]|nr:MAG: winged helix-turn-helix transcriptional regulator [Candidatus Bathyarchaeota archaeon]
MTNPENDENERIQILLTLSRGAKSRRNIMKSLHCQPKNCSQIARDVKLDWWTVQRHLQRLMKDRMVKNSSFGNIKYYRLSHNGKEIIRRLSSDDNKELDEQHSIDVDSVSGSSHESGGKLYEFKFESRLGLNWV